MDYKISLGILATTIGFASYAVYIRDILKRITKPHVFSWFLWGILEGTAFFAQVAGGAGAGSWVTGFTALLCLTVAALALSHGEKNITKSDWAFFITALLGIIIWRLTDNALYAIIIVSITDALGFVPTFRKAFSKPHEETVSLFAISVIKLSIGILATESYNLTTLLYPASLIINNILFVAIVLIRRRQLSR